MTKKNELKLFIKAILFSADQPLALGEIISYLPARFSKELGKDITKQVTQSIKLLQAENSTDSIVLNMVASGYRYQIENKYAKSIAETMNIKNVRYSSALLETLAIIIHKQPVTRGDVEDIRGVSVSQNIFRVLLDRGWVKQKGFRDSLGKPALYVTTDKLIDYFNLENLDELTTIEQPKNTENSISSSGSIEQISNIGQLTNSTETNEKD